MRVTGSLGLLGRALRTMAGRLTFGAALILAVVAATALAGPQARSASPAKVLSATVSGGALNSTKPPVLIRGTGVVRVERLNRTYQGRYDVVFNRDVTKCTAVVSLTATPVGSPGWPGFALAAPNGDYNGTAVFVRTSIERKADINAPFSLVVVCP